MRIYDKDNKRATENIDAVLDAIQANDANKLRSLFAKSTIIELDLFNKQCDNLFEYFTGEVESIDDWGGPFVGTEKEDEFTFQVMESTFDVQTSETKYRCAMKFITQGNSEDIGVVSLYAISLVIIQHCTIFTQKSQ